MRSPVGLGFETLVLLAALAAPSACGGGGDQTTPYVGPWTFSSGALTPSAGCPTTSPLSLAGGPVTITKVDDTTIDFALGTVCDLKFKVNGPSATVVSGQSCTLNVGAPLGSVTVTIKTWTLALAGDRIDNTIDGTALICEASGTGELVRGAPDASAD